MSDTSVKGYGSTVMCYVSTSCGWTRVNRTIEEVVQTVHQTVLLIFTREKATACGNVHNISHALSFKGQPLLLFCACRTALCYGNIYIYYINTTEICDSLG